MQNKELCKWCDTFDDWGPIWLPEGTNLQAELKRRQQAEPDQTFSLQPARDDRRLKAAAFGVYFNRILKP